VVSVPPIVASAGGTPTAFSISPELPLGLRIDPLTGNIQCTPNQVQPMTPISYLISASNSGGSGTVLVTISVRQATEAPKLDFVTPVTGSARDVSSDVSGLRITVNLPVRMRAEPPNVIPVTYSITPPLLAGLVLDPATGVINGSAALEEYFGVTYRLTATNDFGSTSVIASDMPTAVAPVRLRVSFIVRVLDRSMLVPAIRALYPY